MKKATKRFLIGLVATAIAALGAMIAQKGMQIMGLINKLDLSAILKEQYPDVEKWSISSVIFLNTFATTVTCPAELLIENPDAEQRIKQICLEKVPELANLKFSLKMKAAKTK